MSVKRWHAHRCSRCGLEVPEGDRAIQVMTSDYEPMQPGPTWVAVGDWAEPKGLGLILCEGCVDAVIGFCLDRQRE